MTDVDPGVQLLPAPRKPRTEAEVLQGMVANQAGIIARLTAICDQVPGLQIEIARLEGEVADLKAAAAAAPPVKES